MIIVSKLISTMMWKKNQYVNISQENKDRLQRSGDQKLKEKAINTPYYKIARCKCDNNCVDNATNGITMKLRESYWGA